MRSGPISGYPMLGLGRRDKMIRIFAPEALLPEGWGRDVVVEIDDDGSIRGVRARQKANGAEPAGGPLIPGMANAHSQAVQRAMAGPAGRLEFAARSCLARGEGRYALMLPLPPPHGSTLLTPVR